MSTPLDPIISEFETQEQSDSYQRWFRERVQASLDDPRPSIPHDDVMGEMRELIAKRRDAASGVAPPSPRIVVGDPRLSQPT
ncbi:MAG: antitoxin [Gammaproteobacteria bacterium]|nr:antitoxin [Gammaproteobacteria bacterium]